MSNNTLWELEGTQQDTTWVKVYRRLTEHWLYRNPAYTNIWLAILFGTNYRASKAVIRGEVVEIQRGEMLTSTSRLAMVSNTGRQQVRTFLRLAVADGMITVKSNQSVTIVKVLNYEGLQTGEADGQPTRNQRITNGQPTRNHIIRSKEVKKERIEREDTRENQQQRKDKPERMADVVAYFETLGMPYNEAQRFVDYYTANGWKVGRNPMKDWKAASRNWRKGYDEKATKETANVARTAPVGLPQHVVEIANRPKLSSEAVEAAKALYLSKVSPDE